MDNLKVEDLIIGEEYLFSDDGENWEKGTLNNIDGNKYQSKLQSTSSVLVRYDLIKPLGTPERVLYTQSMKDAGKPIEVGMWFKLVDGGECECLLPVDSEGDTVHLNNEGNYVFCKALPFPDPVELIDGEAYEFDYNEFKGIVGIVGICKHGIRYGKEHIILCTLGHESKLSTDVCEYNSEYCTNIRHLTVKGA